MPIKFNPIFTLSFKMIDLLVRIEAAKNKILHLPLTPKVLKSLRETARLYTTHYSTMIEGNSLNPQQINAVLKQNGHFPGREREEHEIKGYYAALTQVEKWTHSGIKITEEMIKTLHALVIADGRTHIAPSPYRDGQNVIKDSRTGAIVYMPPEAKDVQALMAAMIFWLNNNSTIPCPISAAIAHYQFATIHPY